MIVGEREVAADLQVILDRLEAKELKVMEVDKMLFENYEPAAQVSI